MASRSPPGSSNTDWRPVFWADLKTAILDCEQAIHDHSHGKDSRIAARAGIETALQSGFDAVRRLDAVVINTVNDPTIVAYWRAARRVERLPRRNRTPDPAPCPEPGPGPKPVPAPDLS